MDMKPDIISYRTAAKAWGASKVNGSKDKACSLVQRANYLSSSLENLSLLLKQYPGAVKEKDHLGRMQELH
eukprot:3184052-Ditylum_brightwellii.AAC.1